MKLKKIIILSIIAGTIYSSSLYADEKLPKDKPGTAVFVMSPEKDRIIMVTSNLVQEEEDHLSVDLKIPVTHHFKSKIFQRRLNKRIRNQQMCLKSSIEKDALRNYQYATKKGYPVLPYELMSNYHVKSNQDIFSLEITIYDYRGGAHGMTNRTYYNIDTKTCKILSLNEIVPDEERLNKEINRQIEERKEAGQMFFEGKEGFNGVTKDQLFYINQEGQVVVVFGLYEIGPYAAGIMEFPIPKELFD